MIIGGKSEKMNSINYNGRIIEYSLSRKKVKNINLRIYADGSVCVSAPLRVPQSVIEDFLLKNASKIIAAEERFAAAERRSPKLSDGANISLMGRIYRLKIVRGEKNAYAVTGSDILFYLSEGPQPQAVYDKLLRDTAEELFPRLARECLPLFAQKTNDPPLIKIRKMKSQWGNCRAAKNVVTLNSRLAAYDEQIIKFVICHEFCHFTFQNHSKDFYALLGSVMPRWKEYDAVLKNK